MEKKIITSAQLPVAGPYSIAVEAAGFIFISGQLALNPQTGEPINDIKTATRQVLSNINIILTDIGLKMSSIVKTTVYLKNIDDFPSFNEIYGEFFVHDPPSRSTVEVSALPKGVLLEIEAIAARK